MTCHNPLCKREIKSLGDSLHAPNFYKNSKVAVLSCRGCGTSLNVLMITDQDFVKATAAEIKKALEG